MTANDNVPHALYRFYDADGVLLYVGITVDPGARLKKHQGDKEWWTKVARIAIEKLPTRAAVLDAERLAIREERPLWNVVHNEQAVTVRSAAADWRDGYGRLIVCADPAWRRLAAAHPQLLAVERYVIEIGETYIRYAADMEASGHRDGEYVCAQALWYGFGNALDLLGGPQCSIKATTCAVAGLTAGVPLVDDVDTDSWPPSVLSGPMGFINLITCKGWDPPTELTTSEAGAVVYQRMYALMPDCTGRCLCKPQEW